MRLVRARVTALSLLAGVFLVLGVLASWPGTARASALKPAAGRSAGTSANASTDTKCQALPAAVSPSPTPTPSKSPTPKPSDSASPSPSPSGSSTSSASGNTPVSPSPSASRTAPSSPSAASSPPLSNSAPASSSPSTSGSPSASGSSSPSSQTSASLDAYVATSPSPGSSASASPSPSSSGAAAQTQLCVSVQRSQPSIQRGQKAAYVVQISTQNGQASDVSVALAAKPSSLKPAFTSGCAKGNGTATCAVSSVSDKQPVALKAQVPVASDATSVSSVTLTATASIVTSAKWTPPSAAETVAVSSAAASPTPSATSPAAATPGTSVPAGPVPSLNSVSNSFISSSLVGAGNASGLFPAIRPSTGSGSSPAASAKGGKRSTEPVADSSTLALGKPVLTGQLAGLIALAVAVMLTVTRLSLLKRFRSKKQGS